MDNLQRLTALWASDFGIKTTSIGQYLLVHDERIGLGEDVYMDLSEPNPILRAEAGAETDPILERIRVHELLNIFRPLRLAYLVKKYPHSPVGEDYGLPDLQRSELCEAWAFFCMSTRYRGPARRSF